MMHLTVVCLVSFVVATLASPVLSVTSDRNVIENLVKGSVEMESTVKLKGEQYWQSEDGEERGYAYYGYKYGTAGRFEDSVLNADHAYLTNTSRPKLGYVCPHVPKKLPGFLVRNLTMNEDCLFLDVYVPPVKKDQQNTWPVLFWIYGGAFRMGDKDMYNASILVRAVDAIVVTVNYRLSAFGFLSTGDKVARGNWALGDLKLALNWTVANIASFNGDPKKITIFGVSAGGALTSALMLDDNVRHKVSAAVAMSGNVVQPWSIRLNPEKGVKVLGAQLGCPTESSAAIVECLKTQSVEQLLNASAETVEKTAGFHMYYAPVIDGKHITKDPTQLLRERAAGPAPSLLTGTFITGYLAQDSSTFLFRTPQFLNGTFNLTTASNLLAGILISSTGSTCTTNIPLQIKHIFDYYNMTDTMTDTEVRQRYFTISTDLVFGLGSMAESLLYANGSSNSRNQMYLISFDPGFGGLGAFHFVEILHLFRAALDEFLKEKMSDRVTKSMHDFIREIAHNGRAAGPSFGSDGHYLELNQKGEWINKKQNFASLVEFWKELKDLPCPAPST